MSEQRTPLFSSIVQGTGYIGEMDGATDGDSIRLSVDGEIVKVTQIDLDPILNRAETRRIAMTTSCTEKWYSTDVGICNL